MKRGKSKETKSQNTATKRTGSLSVWQTVSDLASATVFYCRSWESVDARGNKVARVTKKT